MSLGCQHLEVKMFNEALGEINSGFEKPILMFDQQNSGTTEKFIGKIISDSYKAIKNANSIIRQPAPLSKLTIGL